MIVFDTYGLRPSGGQQQLNQSQKVSISKRNLNKFLGDVGGLPRWRTTHLEHLQKGKNNNIQVGSTV